MADDREQTESPKAEVYRPPPGAPVWREEERDEISLVQLLNVLLRHRWKVLGLPVAVALLVAGWTVLQPATYTAEASFMPQTSGGGGQLSRFSGVASQFGINVPTGEAGQSPQFYADLVTSPRILRDAVTDSYEVPASAETVRGSLVEIFGIRDKPRPADASGLRAPVPGEALERAVARLEELVSVSSDPETGVVELSVTTPWPELSRQVADRLIDGVNRFNLEVRQSQASAQAEFVGERLRHARRELRAAEDSLENFLQRNVGWQQSPELTFRHDRLQRQVTLRQEVYTSLATRYEEARINEVRNTPVITSVTPPREPVRPDSRRLPLKAVLGLVLGGMLGVFWAFGSEFTDTLKEEGTEEYREFVSLKEDAAGDVKRAGRRIRRLVSGDSPEGET